MQESTPTPGKVTEYTYSPLNLLTTVCDDGGELAAYDYNPDGTVKSLVHGSVRQDYTYNLDKNLVGLKVRSAGELLADNLYQYDGNGNRTRKQQLGGDTYYHYDSLKQLQRVEYPGYTEELFYDKAGNRTRRMAQGVEELYQYDPRNRLIALTKGGVTTRFQYDNAGNLLADDKARYSYDAFNRTTKVETFDGNVQINRYDAEGLRYEMEENGNLVQFIFNQDREAVTEEDSTGLTRLIRSTELIARSTDAVRTYYHYASDEMGSTTHIVDETGKVQNRYAYDAWGNLTLCEEKIPNRFKFTGQQLDPITQQYYLRARFYNPVIARFTQEDTYRGDGLNLYAYCANNPVFYADPSGNASQCMKDAYKSELARLTAEYITEGMSAEQQAEALSRAKKEAYKAARAVYQKNHAANNPTPDLPVVTNKQMTRQQWKEAQRNARMESKPATNLLRQIHDVEQRTGMRVPNKQMAMLMKQNGPFMKLPTQNQRHTHRAIWKKSKKRLIREWEKNTGLSWSKYTSLASGNGYVYKAGWKYDAHEFIPNAYGGPIAWWNIFPVHRDDHQSGIHTIGSVHYQAYPDLY